MADKKSYRNRIKNIAVISEENKEEFHSSSLRNKMKNIAAIAKENNVERMTPAEKSKAYATLQKMYLAKIGGKSRMKKKKSRNRARKTKKWFH